MGEKMQSQEEWRSHPKWGLLSVGFLEEKQKLCKDVLMCYYSPLIVGSGFSLMFILLFGKNYLTSIKSENICIAR